MNIQNPEDTGCVTDELCLLPLCDVSIKPEWIFNHAENHQLGCLGAFSLLPNMLSCSVAFSFASPLESWSTTEVEWNLLRPNAAGLDDCDESVCVLAWWQEAFDSR